MGIGAGRTTTRRIRTAPGTAAAIAVLVLAAGLTVLAITRRHPTRAQDPAVPAVTGVVPRALTVPESDLLDRAEQVATRDCMRRHGFAYWVTPPVPAPIDLLFPYVIDDVAWARRYGFGSAIPDLVARARAANPNARYTGRLSPERRSAYGTALDGGDPREPGTVAKATLPGGGVMTHSVTGCTAAVQGRIYGSFRSWYPAEIATLYLRREWQPAVLRDPRYLRAVSPWRRCMRGRGYTYANPARAAAAFLTSPGPRAQATEIATAVAEAECATATGLADTARRLDTEYAQRLPAPDRRHVELDRRMALGALPRARAVLTADRRAA